MRVTRFNLYYEDAQYYLNQLHLDLMNYKNKNITIRKYTQMIADLKSRFEILEDAHSVRLTRTTRTAPRRSSPRLGPRASCAS